MKRKYSFMFLMCITSCIFADLHGLKRNVENKKNNKEQEEFEMGPTEDLMREHGLLNRILLIYEECMKRIDNNIDFSLKDLEQAAYLVKSFIHDYHEKLEEDYIFSLFEKHKKEVRLVKTLKNQHVKGRAVTAELLRLVRLQDLNQNSNCLSIQDAAAIKKLMKKFIVMYRPHEAREDTVLFPQVRELISEEEFEKLGDMFEDTEHELFGHDGFDGLIAQVKKIEKDLGIYELDQFTPKI
ncbi:MAG TPA: hemerythrin domain-containing protein [Candidatus Saccharimonadales bacterium]|nr:hemerythrin domain-containing protein [Candidatus Saccharimonadales bacterium]